MSSQTADGCKGEHEARNAIKRLHEHDSDTESELDDNTATSSISATLVDLHGEVLEHCDSSSKSDFTDLGPTAFLSFDWENEEPYDRAVDRYWSCFTIDAKFSSDFYVS